MERDFIAGFTAMNNGAIIAVGMQILVFGVAGTEDNIALLLGRDPNLRTGLQLVVPEDRVYRRISYNNALAQDPDYAL